MMVSGEPAGEKLQRITAGALALGAVTLGALASGALAIGRLVIRSLRGGRPALAY